MAWLEGNRKLILCGVILLGVVIGFLMKVIDPGMFKEMVLWIVGLYTGGNVGEHVAKAIGKKNGNTG